jgi:hypothetical protein
VGVAEDGELLELRRRLADELLEHISAVSLELRREQAWLVAGEVVRRRGMALRRELESGRFDFEGLLRDLSPDVR